MSKETQVKEHRYTILDLQQYAFRQGRNYTEVFDEWLDWMIDLYHPDNMSSPTFGERMARAHEENELFFQMMLQWMIDVTAAMERGDVLDWFGEQYEEQVKSRGKAEALGQFYTPMSLCKMMAEVSAEKQEYPEYITADDPACGSGRTLLALEWAMTKHYGPTNKRFYTAADIDHMSVKMCALNMMITGMCGEVLCRDSLRMETFYGYEVNEIRWPIITPLYSIRKVTAEEAAYQAIGRQKRLEHHRNGRVNHEAVAEAQQSVTREEPTHEQTTAAPATKTKASEPMPVTQWNNDGQGLLNFDEL